MTDSEIVTLAAEVARDFDRHRASIDRRVVDPRRGFAAGALKVIQTVRPGVVIPQDRFLALVAEGH